MAAKSHGQLQSLENETKIVVTICRVLRDQSTEKVRFWWRRKHSRVVRRTLRQVR